MARVNVPCGHTCSLLSMCSACMLRALVLLTSLSSLCPAPPAVSCCRCLLTAHRCPSLLCRSTSPPMCPFTPHAASHRCLALLSSPAALRCHNAPAGGWTAASCACVTVSSHSAPHTCVLLKASVNLSVFLVEVEQGLRPAGQPVLEFGRAAHDVTADTRASSSF